MNKNKFNFIVDFLAALAFIASMATGVWHNLLPEGGRRFGVDETVISFRHTIGQWHTWISWLLCFLLLVHILLHYKWIICVFKAFITNSRDCQTK